MIKELRPTHTHMNIIIKQNLFAKTKQKINKIHSNRTKTINHSEKMAEPQTCFYKLVFYHIVFSFLRCFYSVVAVEYYHNSIEEKQLIYSILELILFTFGYSIAFLLFLHFGFFFVLFFFYLAKRVGTCLARYDDSVHITAYFTTKKKKNSFYYHNMMLNDQLQRKSQKSKLIDGIFSFCIKDSKSFYTEA